MANRDGRGPNLPQMNRSSVPVAVAPMVQLPDQSSGARGLFSIGDMMRRMASRAEDRLDDIAQVEGTREGTLDGLKDTLPQLQDDTTIRGQAYNRAARDSAITRIDMQSRLKLSELETKNRANPVGYKSAAEGYLDGVMKELNGFDPALAQRYEADYRLRMDGYIKQLQGEADVIARDKQLETALRTSMAASEDIARDARRLFTDGPQNVEAALTRMTGSAVRISDLANQRGPDGRPLFDARQRVAMEAEAEQVVASQIGLAWMGQQPDQLAAFDAWQRGEATIKLADGQGGETTMKLRDLLGEKNYQTAQGAFFNQLREGLALESQVNTAREHAFKQGSDNLFTEMSKAAQDGNLTLPIVEASRGSLEPEKYLALRELAKGSSATVSDGNAVRQFTIDDADGQDIRGRLLTSYRAGKITTEDFNRLYDRNDKRLGDGMPSTVQGGRDFVANSLGKLAAELDFAQSVAIPKAERDYNTSVDDFVKREGRAPSQREAYDIAQEVVDRWAAADTSSMVANLPKPLYMAPSMKFSSSLSSADIAETGRKTHAEFMRKHNNNVEAMKADPQYQREMGLLKQYSDLLSLKTSTQKVKNAPAAE